MKKKLCFISPAGSFFFKDQNKNTILFDSPGFSVHRKYWSGLGPALPILASLSSSIFEVKIIDENIEAIDYNESFDIVGITAMTQTAIRAYQICAEFRKKGAHTIIGGPHPTYMSDEALLYADTVVLGEAENIWPVLLNDYLNSCIKRKYDSKDYPSVDLKKLPVPCYELLLNKNYSIIWLNSLRGCPYHCEFCIGTKFFGEKIRIKKISQTVEEIQKIQNLFPRILIGFGDNNIFVNRNYTKELIKELKKLNITWIAQTDISIGEDKDLLKELFQAGCQTLFIGFESMEEKNLDNIYTSGKKLKKNFYQKYKEMAENIQSNGIGIWGAFIVGLDEDTPDTFRKTVDFINQCHLLGAQITLPTPLPGTDMRERFIRENIILPTSWDNYTFLDINFIPKKMTEKELTEGLVNALKEIFSAESRIETVRYFKEIMKKII